MSWRRWVALSAAVLVILGSLSARPVGAAAGSNCKGNKCKATATSTLVPTAPPTLTPTPSPTLNPTLTPTLTPTMTPMPSPTTTAAPQVVSIPNPSFESGTTGWNVWGNGSLSSVADSRATDGSYVLQDAPGNATVATFGVANSPGGTVESPTTTVTLSADIALQQPLGLPYNLPTITLAIWNFNSGGPFYCSANITPNRDGSMLHAVLGPCTVPSYLPLGIGFQENSAGPNALDLIVDNVSMAASSSPPSPTSTPSSTTVPAATSTPSMTPTSGPLTTQTSPWYLPDPTGSVSTVSATLMWDGDADQSSPLPTGTLTATVDDPGCPVGGCLYTHTITASDYQWAPAAGGWSIHYAFPLGAEYPPSDSFWISYSGDATFAGSSAQAIDT